MRGAAASDAKTMDVESTLTADLASLRIDRTPAVQSERAVPRKLLAALAGLVAVCGAVAAAEPFVSARWVATEVESTEIAMMSPSQANTQLSASGYVVPQVLAELVPKLAGRVARVHVREGDRVEVGTVLLELEAADQQMALQTARLRAAAAYSLVSVAAANLGEIRLQVERQTDLAKQGATPAANVVDLNARFGTARQQVRAAEAELAAANSAVRAAETTLANMTLISPIAGIVLNRTPAVGDLVGGGGTAGSPSGLIQIADFGSLLVEAEIPEGRLRAVRPGAPCEIVLEAYPDKPLRGEAIAVMPRVNRAKASVTVKVKFLEPAADSLPDMAARVNFLERAEPSAAPVRPPIRMVAAEAVVQRGGEPVVFVMAGDKVRMTRVTLGAARDARVELKTGPAAGVRVVKAPPDSLADGQRVRERTSS